MTNNPEIKTNRLFLRTLTESDVAIVRLINGDDFKTDEAAIEHIRWTKDAGRLFVLFYIWLIQTGQCVGEVYIHSKPELNGEVEIGYSISEEHRNNDYATEAAQAVIKFAFEQTGQEVLCAIIKPENIASRRVIEKLGFKNFGVRTVLDENNVDCEFDYFQLYRDDWRLFTE